ncbi:hypothetical protein HWV62_28840 [Athelia sp. TMB]|nr:hypothetical protein HWV62_44703 [Athelia sp. TMB]KAF7968942.1 hypothetical protein HWV62_28840 [Athelia sp. TMB]
MSDHEMTDTSRDSPTSSEYSDGLPPPPPDIPGVRFVSIYTAVRSADIDDAYPYLLSQPVGVHRMHRVPHYEFRAPRPPSVEIGTPGDIWIDLAAGHVFICTYTGSGANWERWRTTCTREENRTAHPYFANRYLSYSYSGRFGGGRFQWVTVSTLRRRDRLRHGQVASVAELVAQYLRAHGHDDDDDTALRTSRALRAQVGAGHDADPTGIDVDPDSDTQEFDDDIPTAIQKETVSFLRKEITRLEQALVASEDKSHGSASEQDQEKQLCMATLADELTSAQTRISELEASRERNLTHTRSLDGSLRDARAQVRALEAGRKEDQAHLDAETAVRLKLADQLAKMRQVMGEAGP